MSIIEQAARRLAELQRTGIDIADNAERSPNVTARERIPLEDTLRSRRSEPQVSSMQAVRDVSGGHDVSSMDAEPLQKSRRVDLDMARIAASGIVTPDAPRSQVADEFRVVKRPLIANATKKGPTAIRNGNLIIITSAVPGEGKSFTAANLAMSIAMEMDHTVLLVDADVARPSLPEMLGLPPAHGLLDLLVDDSLHLSDVMLKTNVEKLSFLLSGTPHPRATELLASEAMNRLLDEMAQRYSDRIIIFDSPPLLVTTEARVLATHMGQVVLVVQAERTAQADVKHALATIETCPVKLMILNQARAAAHSAYGYGYGYGS